MSPTLHNISLVCSTYVHYMFTALAVLFLQKFANFFTEQKDW